MDISNKIDNYDFIKLGELNLSPDTKIIILYARFMHNSSIIATTSTHSHTFYELHIPLQGSCDTTMKDSIKGTLCRGDYLLVHPNTNHKFSNLSEDFFRLSVAFDIQRNNKLLSDYDNYILAKTDEKIDTLLASILTEYTSQDLGYKNTVSLYINAMMIELFRKHSVILSKSKHHTETNKNALNDALTFIRNNIAASINTEDVAKHANLSSRQLNRIFTHSVNMTVSGFIKNERITSVCEHLKKTDLSLQEIASLTGFNDEYVLCKVFKKLTGITPGKYRAQHQKKG